MPSAIIGVLRRLHLRLVERHPFRDGSLIYPTKGYAVSPISCSAFREW